MIKRLDRYVGLAVLGAYGAGLLFMMLMFILVDVLISLGDYLDAAQEADLGTFELLGRLTGYYLIWLPVVFVTIAPFVSVIAGMFAAARLMAVNEIAPMVFTGRSMTRVLRPVLLTAAASAAMMVFSWEYLIPRVAGPLHDARSELTGGGESALENLVVKLREGGVDQTLIVRSYNHRRAEMSGVSMLDRGSGPEDAVSVQASSATWDPAIGDWQLEGGERVTERLATSQDLLSMAGVTPSLLWRLGKEGRETMELSYSDLLDLQALRPGRPDYVLAFHSHITFPLANLVLLLLALPFAVDFERGNRIGRVVFAILVCAVYLVADLTCQNLGRSHLHPVLAAWLPTILFGSVGIVFFGSIRT